MLLLKRKVSKEKKRVEKVKKRERGFKERMRVEKEGREFKERMKEEINALDDANVSRSSSFDSSGRRREDEESGSSFILNGEGSGLEQVEDSSYVLAFL